MNKRIEKLFFDTYWACAARRLSDGERDMLPDDGRMKSYRLLRPGRAYWCADPFLADGGDGAPVLFCERMRKYTKKAVIAAGAFEAGGRALKPVLSPGCHTSYPAVFRCGGVWYMIPETLNARTVELWRAVSFPARWERAATLLDGFAAADTTPFPLPDGGVGLFLYEPDDAHNVRRLWSARLDLDRLTVSEPVLLTAYPEKTGRPAGNVLTVSGRSIRPTQDGQMLYGGAVEFFAYEFSEDGAYRETPAGRLTPASIRIDAPWKVLGVHTVNRLGDLEIIDVFYRRFAPLRALDSLLFRLFGKGDAS